MTLGMRSGALQPIPLNFGQMEVSITLTIDTGKPTAHAFTNRHY